jgi:hypothetical protein
MKTFLPFQLFWQRGIVSKLDLKNVEGEKKLVDMFLEAMEKRHELSFYQKQN